MPLIINVPRSTDRIQVEAREQLSLAFFGTPQFAVPTLRLLQNEGWPISLVVTAPDKPVGRKAIPTPSAVRSAAEELGMHVVTPATLKDEAFVRSFQELRPDIGVVVAYGKLIPKTVLDVPRLGFVNLHPSLLPAYRGPSPIRSAILDGCSSTGVSIMLLDAEMDHGPILSQQTWQIPTGFYAPACESELSVLGARLMVDTIDAYARGAIAPNPQDHTAATVTRKFVREDGRLDWTQPVTAVFNRIRALSDEPGTWTTWQSATLNIIRASIHAAAPHAVPGTVVRIPNGVGIACQDGVLLIERVLMEGGKEMDAMAFVNGHPNFIGSRLG